MTYVLHGHGAITLRHIPVDHDGHERIVDAATFEIVDVGYGEGSAERPVASGAATIGSVNTLLSAAAGPGQTDTDSIPATSSSGVSVGRPYLLVGADGTSELVSVRAVVSNTVHTHRELRHDYGTDASLRSVEITAAFPALEANADAEIERTPHPYAVMWTYTIDGDIHVVRQLVWLSRVTVVPLIDELYVLKAYPTIGPRLRGRADIASAIAVATEDYTAEVLAQGRRPTEFHGNETARVAVRARALEYCLRWCGPAVHDVSEADRFRAQFQYLMGQLLAGVPRPGVVTVDQTTNTGKQETKAAHPLFARR
jgi:hypothetical protein